jgi:signal transduction histidine kinase
MGDIIWAINPDKKAHKSISGQLKDFYFDLMDGYGIQCDYHIDLALESQITNINARKHLLLIAKEAINNILKHANANRIDVFLKEQDKMVLLEIQDNGIGMQDPEKTFSGNGLLNMKYRAEKIEGKFNIKSEVGVGTTISCLVPLTNISYPHSMAG